jgi:hypothetical protein
VVAGLLVGVVACGDDDSASTTTVTTTLPPTTTNPGPVGSADAALCTARDDLKASITALASVDVIKSGTSGITDALSKIKDDLAAVRSAAGSNVQPQVDAFQQALDSLQTALGGSGAAKVAATVAALRDVASTGSTLLTSLGNLTC